MSFSRSLFFIGIASVALSACAETRQDIGLGRNPPDEFAVVERPPLSMPPDYTLRPPRPGAARPQAVDTDQQASAALFEGKAPSYANAPSESEKALLESSGASKADPDIRQTVDRESAQKVSASPHLVQRLVDWTSDKTSTATTVDAKAEADRIKKAKESNQPLNSGATPVIEKQESGWLGL